MNRCVRTWAVLLLGLCCATHAHAQPQRIVSLNLCVDQILIDLVAKERIAALSFLSIDTAMSAVATRAKNFARVRGNAESILAMKPDLVITGAYSTPATRQLLKRLGKRVVVVDQPVTIAGVRGLVRQLAELVGATERGQAMIEAFNDRLARAREAVAVDAAEGARTPTALAIHVNGIVSQPGALLHDAMQFAGLRNAAADMVASRRGRVPLEAIARRPPDILVFANAPQDFTTVLADNLRHPIYQNLVAQRPAVSLPMWATLCGTPYIAEAVERLANARAELERGRR